MKKKFKEPQYSDLEKIKKKFGISKLGIMSNEAWTVDPKCLLFSLSRYKFVSKLLSGETNVLEVGCGDGFYSRIVAQTVKKLTAIDFDDKFISEAKNISSKKWPIQFIRHDIISSPLKKENFSAIYSLDVFEHIEKKKSNKFISNCKKSLKKKGSLIIGIPSIESQKYASKMSKAGHVNCLSGQDFKKFLKRHFDNVFIFSMNDEVVHTGFYKMSNYLIAVCTGKK